MLTNDPKCIVLCGFRNKRTLKHAVERFEAEVGADFCLTDFLTDSVDFRFTKMSPYLGLLYLCLLH